MARGPAGLRFTTALPPREAPARGAVVIVDSMWGKFVCGFALGLARYLGNWDDATGLCAYIMGEEL